MCVCMCVCVSGDDMDHEQDTVLQLQEVIEQLRNVFPSEPGEFISTTRVLRRSLRTSVTFGRAEDGEEGRFCTAAG